MPSKLSPIFIADQLKSLRANKPMGLIDQETREVYLHRAANEGIDATLTAIHNDVGQLEHRVFDGGFQQDRFERVQSLRLLARELWNIKLRSQSTQAYGETEATYSFGNFAKTDPSS